MKYCLLISLGVLTVLSSTGYGQQQTSYLQYMYNTLYINPAYAGYYEDPIINVAGSSQFHGIEGAPKSVMLSVHGRALSQKTGLGATIVNDKIGVTNTSGIYGNYSFKLISKNPNSYTSWGYYPKVLSIGLQAGISSYREDLASLDTSYDPTFVENINAIIPNFGFGVYYSKHSYYIGFSVPQLLNGKFGINSELVNLYRHAYMNAGKRFKLAEKYNLELNTLLKYVEGSPLQIDVNGIFTINEVLSLGVGYTSFSSLNFMAGFNFNRSLRIGYFYRLPILSNHNRFGEIHELMLSCRVIRNKN